LQVWDTTNLDRGLFASGAPDPRLVTTNSAAPML